MLKPVLVIMAAGMGSRYGGLKQIDPVDSMGHMIIDFSIFDAKRAGFEEVVLIIKKENEQLFKESIGKRIEKMMKVRYVYQQLDALPEGYDIPSGRTKPWGTAHAIHCCKDAVKGPFAVINADDYYGKEAFELIYQYLIHHQDDEYYRYVMVGYEVAKTLTENGSVSRGVCQVDNSDMLLRVDEKTDISKRDGKIVYEENGQYQILDEKTIVSMNMWGFTHSIFNEIENGMKAFLDQGLKENPLKCEYYIPSVVSSLIESKKASVKVLKTSEQWYGVTYKEDKPMVERAIENMKGNGIYPIKLW